MKTDPIEQVKRLLDDLGAAMSLEDYAEFMDEVGEEVASRYDAAKEDLRGR